MNKRDTNNIIKREFKDISTNYGFMYRSDSELVKVTDENIIEIICFELADFGINCRVALQPLYIFDSTPGVISLNMGARLSRFKTSLPEWW